MSEETKIEHPKGRIKYPADIDLKYGYLTEKFTTLQGFPIIFFCKNYKCNSEFRITNYEQFDQIANDRLCSCGWRLTQYVLKDDCNI